ncbi:hypothetical protein RBK84_00025, partial [Pseudomonas aeruginosa]|uniref:hypothetical protein n=1 Tax=Pseudomonas aeruginosa TaxID=287 RepID=UPI0027D37FBC
VSATHNNVEIETMDFNNALESDYESLFQNVSNEIHETNSFEPLANESETCPTSSVKESSTLELKPLPDHLKYAYLGDNETFPVIIAVDLSLEQENSLLSILKKYKDAIGWLRADIKGISPSIVQHRIHLIDDAKPTRDAQRRLNPIMKDAVREEILKLLDNSIIYPIS